jgi:hypothetical protein
MRSGVVLTVGLALTLLAGCGGASPVSPGESKAAKLVLTDLSVIATRLVDPPVWAYDPRFRIIETSGRSGAVIKKVVISAPFPVAWPDSVAYESNEDCWRIQVRVDAGGTLNAFYAPGVLGWCFPEFTSSPAEPLPSLGVTVTYVDDDGGTGVLGASIPVVRKE